jgi:hypothetical protein
MTAPLRGERRRAYAKPSFTKASMTHVIWLAKEPRRSRSLYRLLAYVTIGTAAATGCLAGVNAAADSQVVGWVVAVLSFLTAFCTGVSQKFKDYDNWKGRSFALGRHKAEGATFLNLAGPYRRVKNHSEAATLR